MLKTYLQQYIVLIARFWFNLLIFTFFLLLVFIRYIVIYQHATSAIMNVLSAVGSGLKVGKWFLFVHFTFKDEPYRLFDFPAPL